jgi:uncharacterized membrane protein YidH (DUF202 family)
MAKGRFLCLFAVLYAQQNFQKFIREQEATERMKNRKGRFFFSSFFSQKEHIVGYRRSVIRHGDPIGSRNTTPNSSMPGFGAEGEGIFPEIRARLKQKRKLELELSPKVPFANERTLLAWFHWAILLSGSSLALSSFHTVEDQPLTQIYGLILIPLAVSVILYSLTQCKLRVTSWRSRALTLISQSSFSLSLPSLTHSLIDGRRSYLIHKGVAGGVFYDTVGPLILGAAMLISLIAGFSFKSWECAS